MNGFIVNDRNRGNCRAAPVQCYGKQYDPHVASQVFRSKSGASVRSVGESTNIRRFLGIPLPVNKVGGRG